MRFEGDSQPLSDGGPEIPVELVRSLLSLLRTRLGLDTAWLSLFHDGMQTIEVLDGDSAAVNLASGDQASLSDSYCVRVVDGRLPSIIPDTAANQTTAALPITGEWNLGAYVGVPVRSPSGATIGMVCAVSGEARPYLADIDLRVVKQVADLVGTLLESPNKGQDTTAAERAEIRKVVYQRDFDVVFQPIHDVTSGKVMGVEALARFPRAPFRPDAFLAQAALLGLDVELETAILARVISLVPRLPVEIFVAMNISPGAAVAAPWTELLADTDPSRLVLELTEHDAVLDYGALEEALEPCRARGVRIAVDDVGAGFSSFSHVLELNPEFVKIDQSLTRHIDVDDARRRLAHAIAELAGQLGATVIAEGVESQGELNTVAAVGITAAQGFLLSRPTSLSYGFEEAEVTAEPVDVLRTEVDLLGERRFELALAHSPIGMAVVGLDGTFLRTNRALRVMLGYSKRELAELTFQEITHPDDLDADLALLTDCLEGRRRSFRLDKRYIASDGRIVWGALTAVIVHATRNRPRYFVSQIVDVTADRDREAELIRQATTDPLTGIANRSAGWNRLERSEATGAGYGLLFCDIERFKAVNDQYGHRAGDQVLIEVARRLRETVEGRHMVARWGGDEFLVITDSVDEAELVLLAERITESLNRTPVALTDGTQLSVGLTICWTSRRADDGHSIDAVLDRAAHAIHEKRQR